MHAHAIRQTMLVEMGPLRFQKEPDNAKIYSLDVPEG